MRRTETFTRQTRQSFLAVAMGGILLLTASPARAFDIGLINTYTYDTTPEKVNYGFLVMMRQEVWHYFDIGGRFGYMKSESLKIDSVPVLVTAAVKYPLFEGSFVPFVGIMGGYHLYPATYKPSESLGPNGGFDWRFGKRKEWSVFVEGSYDFKDHAHLRSNNAEIPLGGGPGGSIGVTYRF